MRKADNLTLILIFGVSRPKLEPRPQIVPKFQQNKRYHPDVIIFLLRVARLQGTNTENSWDRAKSLSHEHIINLGSAVTSTTAGESGTNPHNSIHDICKTHGCVLVYLSSFKFLQAIAINAAHSF